MLSTAQIKNDFPILKRTNKDGQRLVYLDNAATTQKPTPVIEAITDYYQNYNSNVHRGIHFLGIEATTMFEDTREAIKQFMGVSDDFEIIFVKGTTEAINLVVSTYGDQFIKRDDSILISEMEHHSNLVPWQNLAKEKQAHLDVISLTSQGDIDLVDFRSKLHNKTKVLAIPHISNTLGTINPVDEMVYEARKKGVVTLIDGAQSIGHQPINIKQIDCDFFVFSAHKMYGPTGIGVLCGRKELLQKMKPYQFGGDMIESVSFEDTTYADLPYRFEAGTPNIAGAAGLLASVRYLQEIGMDQIKDNTEKLTGSLVQKLEEVPNLNLIGKPKQRGSIVSFTMDNAHPHDVATILDNSGVAIRAGHHCTMPLMRSMEIPGTNRASLGIYNDTADIEALCDSLLEVNKIF